MEETKLFNIAPPDDNRPPHVVAEEIIHLIRHTFRFNTAMLCRLFHCDRQWIDQNIRPEVRHIFVTYFFRQYMVETYPDLFQEGEADRLMHGFYFYSEESLNDYWNAHAYAERKTVVVDLALYRRPYISADALRQEYDRHRKAKPCAKEKERHEEKLGSLINEEGMRIYRSGSERKEWSPCPLSPLQSRFITAAEYRAKHKLNSNTAAMQHMFQRGGVRVKIGSRALWIVDEKEYYYPVAIQAP